MPASQVPQSFSLDCLVIIALLSALAIGMSGSGSYASYLSPAPSYTPLRETNPVDEYSQSYPLQQSHRAQQQRTMHPGVQETKGGDWQESLCDCTPCGSCVLGTFVPCLLVGRTASRLQDPTSQSPDMFNGDCMIHGFLTMFASGWIYSMIKRGDIRRRFGIPGSGCGDCCAAFWCQCCQVIQADKEVAARLAPLGVDSHGYVSQAEGMVAYSK